MKKGNLSLKLTIIISAIMGSLGFILWAIGLTKWGVSSPFAWAGGIIVAFISFLIAFLSRWLK